jgi:hypothetical protein
VGAGDEAVMLAARFGDAVLAVVAVEVETVVEPATPGARERG